MSRAAITLKLPMDRQQIFDQGVAHLMRQGAPSMCGKGNYAKCLYRSTYDGKPVACLIGGLFADEKYRLSMESMSVSAVLRMAAVGHSVDDTFLSCCQRIHDDAALCQCRAVPFIQKVVVHAGGTARRYRLNTFALRACIAARAGAL